MIFEKNNSDSNVLDRIIYAVYIYACLEVPRQNWLKEDKARMYAEMLMEYAQGAAIGKYGWMAGLKLDGVPGKNYRYILASRIKEKGWFLKERGQFFFPERLIKMVDAIVNNREATYVIKL